MTVVIHQCNFDWKQCWQWWLIVKVRNYGYLNIKRNGWIPSVDGWLWVFGRRETLVMEKAPGLVGTLFCAFNVWRLNVVYAWEEWWCSRRSSWEERCCSLFMMVTMRRRRVINAPTWNGDLNFSKWRPNGDLILSERGTKWGPSATEMRTKWGPKKRIFDELTKTS